MKKAVIWWSDDQAIQPFAFPIRNDALISSADRRLQYRPVGYGEERILHAFPVPAKPAKGSAIDSRSLCRDGSAALGSKASMRPISIGRSAQLLLMDVDSLASQKTKKGSSAIPALSGEVDQCAAMLKERRETNADRGAGIETYTGRLYLQKGTRAGRQGDTQEKERRSSAMQRFIQFSQIVKNGRTVHDHDYTQRRVTWAGVAPHQRHG